MSDRVDDATKYDMIAEARMKHNHITPCVNKDLLIDCFTVDNGNVVLWFNTADGSTHTIVRRHKAMGE